MENEDIRSQLELCICDIKDIVSKENIERIYSFDDIFYRIRYLNIQLSNVAKRLESIKE